MLSARKGLAPFVDSIIPETWKNRRGLPLTYRMTQVLTGNGVFGEYLKKIGREETDLCHHCGEGRDTAQHTLEFCPAWELPRYNLRIAIGECLAPSAVLEAMLNGPREYEAVRFFCEQVMLVKERAEREREKNSHPCRVTRRREMTVRRPRVATPKPRRTAIRRRIDGAGVNGPPLAPKYISYERTSGTDSGKRKREVCNGKPIRSKYLGHT